jgi:cell division inhibitor SepF
MVSPKSLNDAEIIVDYLQDRISVVVNFEETPEKEIKQIIDVIKGKTYGVAGIPEQISEKIFVFTPNNVVVESVDKDKKFW